VEGTCRDVSRRRANNAQQRGALASSIHPAGAWIQILMDVTGHISNMS